MGDSSDSESISLEDNYHKNNNFIITPPDGYNKELLLHDIDEDICTDCLFNYRNNFWLPLIISLVTVIPIIIIFIISSVKKYQNTLIIVSRSIPIVNEMGAYILWGFHCGALIALPWLLFFLQKSIHSIYLISSPIMMLLNIIGGTLNIRYSCYPIIFELIIVSVLIYRLPINSNHPLKDCKSKLSSFFLEESLLMALGFIFVSASLGASTLSYIIFAPHIRIDGFVTFYPNPYYSIDYLNVLYKTEGIKQVTGGFLSVYSLLTFLSVTFGFIMSFRNSLLMIIPFVILIFSVFSSSITIGIILIIQLIIHITYYILLHRKESRKFIAGFSCEKLKFFRECCNATANTIFIGDLISFSIFAFPIVCFMNGGYQTKFPWNFYFAGTIPLMLGIAYHLFLIGIDRDRITDFILAPVCIEIGTYIIGFYFKGYVPLIRSFTFVITYLSWSITLSFFGKMNGFSPILFKTYHALIPIASLVVVTVYDGFGVLEILYCIIQVVFNVCLVPHVQFFKRMEIGWAFIFVGGIAVFGLVSSAIVAAFFAILYLFSCLIDKIEYIGIENPVQDLFKYIKKDDIDDSEFSWYHII